MSVCGKEDFVSGRHVPRRYHAAISVLSCRGRMKPRFFWLCISLCRANRKSTGRVARPFPQKRIAKFVDVLKSGPSPVLDAERRSADRRKRKKGHGLEKSSPFLPNREAQLFPFRRSVPRYVDIGRSRCSKSSAPPAKGASRIVRALCRRRAADDSRARETGTGQVRFSDVLAANGTEKRIPCDSRPDRLFGEIAKERRRGRRALSTVRP